MRTRTRSIQHGRRHHRSVEATSASGTLVATSPAPAVRRSAYYAAGPALTLQPAREQLAADALSVRTRGEIEAGTGPVSASPMPGPEVETVPSVYGTGPEDEATAYGKMKLTGHTDANFDGGAFSTENIVAVKGEGCKGCPANQCVHATGDLVVAYSVTTTVTLPSATNFPNLTPCQQKIVQDGIDTVLAPHEQQHVQAFSRYNGTTRTPFDLTLCRATFDATIKDMFKKQEAARRKSAKDDSAALDPFSFDVDPKCEEPPAEKTKP